MPSRAEARNSEFGGVLEREHRRLDDERGERRRAAQLVHLQQGLLQRQTRLLGSAARDDFGGLDRSQLNGRGGAGRVAADQGLAQAGEALGNLLTGLGTDLRTGKTISQHRSLGLKCLLKAPQSELGGLDLPVRDRATQAQPFRPLEGLAQRRRPDLTLVEESTARIAQSLAADLDREDGIGIGGSRRACLAFSGQGSDIALALGIGLDGLADKVGDLDRNGIGFGSADDQRGQKEEEGDAGKGHGFVCMRAQPRVPPWTTGC